MLHLTRTATRSCRTRKRAVHFCSPGVVRRIHAVVWSAAAAAADTALGYLLIKIRHHAIVENIVFNLYATFNDDRLWNENALVHWKSDNNNPNNKHKNKNNNVHGHLWPVSGSKKQLAVLPTAGRPKTYHGDLSETDYRIYVIRICIHVYRLAVVIGLLGSNRSFLTGLTVWSLHSVTGRTDKQNCISIYRACIS